MLARWIAIVATLLLACANPQASAHVRAERVSTSLADWAAAERSAHANKTALPAKSATNPQTARPARSGPDNPTPGKNAALSDCRVWGNWSPLQKCASMPAVYQWDGTKLAGRTNAVGNSLGDYQHAYAWPISSREGTERSTLHADTHGTPQLITTATGAIAGWTRTDVWGVEKAQSGAQSRIGHTGYLKDPLLDELYAQARQYRAGVGRFTTVDEWAGDINNPISLNKYLYGYGNPGSFVDPDGRTPALIGIGQDLSRHRMDGIIGVTAARDGFLEGPWYAKPGMAILGSFDIGKTLIAGGSEALVAGSNLGANTVISGLDLVGLSEVTPGLATAAEQSNAELNAHFEMAFPAYDAARANPGTAAWNAVSVPFTSAEKAILENDTSAQITLGQQAFSLPGVLKAMTLAVVLGGKKQGPNDALIVEPQSSPGVAAQLILETTKPDHGSGRGRRGNPETRAQIDEVRDQYLDASPDLRHIGGGTDRVMGNKVPEEYIPGPGGSRTGSSYPDLTFEAPDGSRVRVNTVDANAKGVWTKREADNANRMYNQTGEPVIAIPKPRPKKKVP